MLMSFKKLKELLVSAPVLEYPRFGDRVSNASGVGLGAILSQEQEDGQIHPIAYASRTLDPVEKNCGFFELETLGLEWALRYFCAYLLRQPCVVYTDHIACLTIFDTYSKAIRKTSSMIQEVDITIKHKSGAMNANAESRIVMQPLSTCLLGRLI